MSELVYSLCKTHSSTPQCKTFLNVLQGTDRSQHASQIAQTQVVYCPTNRALTGSKLMA
jgi:hypothetical protein